ncbi:MAG: hypothetical protein ACD_47C00246G0001 [uncultured bacterium]|nr:MAG: hypothetical protein ACD_47C00246G0001 [uncultured bacterium]
MSQAVVFVEYEIGFEFEIFISSRFDQTDTAAGDVAEADVVAYEFFADQEEKGERGIGIVDLIQEGRIEPV